jgi:glyoxylase-like metal-dependent hydrolase (beta-lactamase superfamily II)
MRAVSVHPDVIVLTSRVWQTTCTIVRGGDEAFVIDSPVYPDELELLPAILQQAGFRFTGLLATHGDWDHLLGRLAFPDAALGVSETTAARLRGTPAEAQRELRDFDDQHYVVRPRPLALGQIEALPVPGFCGLGDREMELHPADGHTDDGMAVFAEWAGVLICGDYVSPVEIPIIRGSPTAYLATLGRLGQLVERAEWVIPGHGEPLGRVRAGEIVRDHVDYVEAMIADPLAVRPAFARGRPAQRRLHAENVERLVGRREGS